METQPELQVAPNIYSGPFPRFERPTIVGFIGLENLKFARRTYEGAVRFDLNLHYEKAIHKPEDQDARLTDLLKFLLQHEVRLNYLQGSSLNKAQFFCYRGLMTCVACTPYENRESWKIVALLHKGSIYLCARDTDEKKKRKQNMTEQEKRFTSWGYKFEQYMLSDKPDEKPNPNLPVDENEEFSLVFTTNLNHHRIVYGAEMDGIICDRHAVSAPPSADDGIESILEYLSNEEFIELKTNRHIQHLNQERSFRRFKAKKWWCQSYLAGVDSILCGLRDDDGIVEQLKLFSVKELAKMSQKFWSANVCLNFLDNFFTYVKRCLGRKIKRLHGEKALDDLQTLPLISIMFEWNPGMAVKVNENYVHEDDCILSDWFVDNYGQNKV